MRIIRPIRRVFNIMYSRRLVGRALITMGADTCGGQGSHEGRRAVTNQLTRGGAEDEREFPLFLGVVQVLDLIKKLYQRRRRPQRREFTEASRGRRRGPKWLPMLCLVRPERQSALLPALSSWLNEADPHRVPHAYVELTPDRREPTREPRDTKPPRGPWTRRDVEAIRDNLRNIANALADPRNGRTRHLRFPRFGHAHWLMKQELPDYEPSERRAQLRKELQKRSPDPLRFVDDAVSDTNPPSWWWYVRTALNIGLPPWFALKASGRVRWPGRVAYHFMHQNYLAPDDPGTFLGFAERLTNGEWQKESPEQLAKLLVGAFLEDLRAEYRGPFWSAGRRRTSYALVLLDNITRHNGGYTLQKTINNVRNDTAAHDPLLLITASAKVPPHAAEPNTDGLGEVVFDATEANDGYDAWRNELTVKRRDRQEMAFYLPISTFNEPDEEQVAPTRRKLRAHRPFLDGPPWWSRRALWVVLAFALTGAAAWGYAQYSYSHCGNGVSWPGFNPALSWTGEECIGVTDGSYDFFTGNKLELGSISTKFAQLNDETDQKYRDNPQRGMVTIAYVGAFSSRESSDAASQRETMAGIALAQQQNNKSNNPATPIVRVLSANAGDDMLRGEQVARQLMHLQTEDPALIGSGSTLVGAVGFDHSSDQTTKTVEALNDAALPVVAAPLSSDQLSDSAKYPLYRSIAPNNDREARVASTFAQEISTNADFHEGTPTAPKMHVFHDESDAYSNELKNDVHRRAAPGIELADEEVDPTNPKDAGRRACGLPGLVYFAGRGDQFESFLEGVSSACASQKVKLPTILASDDVSRFVADQSKTDSNESDNHQAPFYFESFAVPSTGDPAHDPNRLAEEEEIYTTLSAEHWRQLRENDSLDGHALLAHAATTSLLRTAEGDARGRSTINGDNEEDRTQPSLGSVLQEFVRTPPDPNKPISIVEVDKFGRYRAVAACGGPAHSQRPQLPGCHAG